LKIPVATRTRVTRIIGQGRVSAIEIEHLDTHARRTIECDTVIFTGDWIPDNELARAANLEIDPNTRGPLIDTRQATTTPGVFAIGNLTHPVDTADVAALDGRAVAQHVLAHLQGQANNTGGPRIKPGHHLKWVTPGILNPTAQPPRGRLLAWTQTHINLPTVTITQDRTTLARRRLPWPASPGRAFRIPASLLAKADGHGSTITIELE
jgi:NADH dehydrogenase FAD-containing subunit